MRRKRKVPFNCYLNIDQLDALDRISSREGRARAEIVREAVERYLVSLGEEAAASEGDAAVSGSEMEAP